MGEYEKVIFDIKSKLYDLRYDDEKLENIKQKLTYDIVKSLNRTLEESKKKEVEINKKPENEVVIERPKSIKKGYIKSNRYKMKMERGK